jgi:DNA-binding response OmpR family regulator
MVPTWTVLVVEDNEDLLEIVQLMLSRAGYRVIAMRDAATALAVLSQIEPDVMVLDYQLPGICGFELLARLKTQGKFIPTLLTSGAWPPCPGYLLGVRDFLLKPYEPQVLVDRIAKVIVSEGLFLRWRALSAS